MSSSTKIVVLKLKELLIAGVLALLAVILLILLIIHILSGSDKPDSAITTSYTPGIYTSSIVLSGNTMDLEVCVDYDNVKSITLVNTATEIATMYPLLTASLADIEKQIKESGSTDSITYSSDAKYTSIVLIEAINTALSKAQKAH